MTGQNQMWKNCLKRPIAFWKALLFLKIATKWREIQFYLVMLFQDGLFVISLFEIEILLSILWPHFPPKTVKIEEQKSYDCFEYKVLPSCKLWAQTDKNCTGNAEVTGSNPVEALIFFQASSFQLLKLESLLRWSFFTLKNCDCYS